MKTMLDNSSAFEGFLKDWDIAYKSSPVKTFQLLKMAKRNKLPLDFKKPKKSINLTLGRLLGNHKGLELFGRFSIERNNRTMEWTLTQLVPDPRKPKKVKLGVKPPQISTIVEISPTSEPAPELPIKTHAATQDFFDELNAHLIVLGGTGLTDSIMNMTLGEFVNHIYPNDLRLRIVNLRLKEEYR